MVLNEQAELQKGEGARMASFIGAIAIADLVKSTLGPKGMDKILVSMSQQNGPLVVTNDGATILKQLEVEHPAARDLVQLSEMQDNEDGDGTNTDMYSGFWSGVVCEATVTLGADNVTNYKFGAYQKQKAMTTCERTPEEDATSPRRMTQPHNYMQGIVGLTAGEVGLTAVSYTHLTLPTKA